MTICLVLTSCGLFATTTNAELSYNVGWASEYYYRGILQKESSASAGVDFEQGGFYAGSWAADVGDGLEVDGYFGYGFELDGGFTAGVGFTGYYYTGDFDDTYQEINLNLGYSNVSLEYSFGEWDGNGGEDYDFLALTVDLTKGFYAKFATFGQDFDGDYIELGWGTTVSDIDIGITAIFNSKELSDQIDSRGEALVFSIGKSF